MEESEERAAAGGHREKRSNERTVTKQKRQQNSKPEAIHNSSERAVAPRELLVSVRAALRPGRLLCFSHLEKRQEEMKLCTIFGTDATNEEK